MSDCIFCKIVAGEIPAEKVYEDEYTFAFLDINPVNPGHTLVLPKEHSRNILDISIETLHYLSTTVQTVARALTETGAQGINVHSNNEVAANQAVFHTHMHIIPRYEHDDVIPWHGKPYQEGEMQKMGEKIRDALKKSV